MKTILCIDDEPAILRALQRDLSRHGRVLTASGPAHGLSVLAQEPVSVVLSDFNMPGMDGLQLLHLMRKSYPQTVRIVLSGNEMDPQDESMADAEVFRFLLKPWDRSELHQTVERALSRAEPAALNEAMR
jgi:DNA-binding NtrC family response regulator